MCEKVALPGGGFAIICGGRHRRRAWCRCGQTATRLCDHRNSNGRTCDAPLCEACAFHVGKNRDYCRFHAKQHADEAPPLLPFEEPA